MAKQDKRQAIMEAAEKLFKDRRFHEITLDELARVARVCKGTSYLHFKDKDDLFFQTATSGFEGLCELLHRKVPEKAPFSKQILSACAEISEFFKGRRQLIRMMQTEEGRMLFCHGRLRELWQEKRKKLAAALAAIIRKGVEAGEIRADIPPEILASFLLGMLRTRGHDLADAPEQSRRYELVTDLFRNGAGRQADKRPAKD